MDKKLILPRLVRMADAIREVHETAEMLSESGTADEDVVAHVRELARGQQKEILRLCNTESTHELLTDGEFYCTVALISLPVLALIGGIACGAAMLLSEVNIVLAVISFIAIALCCAGFATSFIWGAIEKNFPKFWRKTIGNLRLNQLERDLCQIQKL